MCVVPDLASLSVLPQPKPSACPGLLRIVAALDGGICRVKLPGGVLTSAQARVVAEAAQRHASGLLELTNRSNLQIRGVRKGEEEPLIRALLASGLGPRQADADDVRNLMLSPTAGLDPLAVLDTRPLAAEVLTLLENTGELHQLSAKFAVQLDGGEGLSMRHHPHDLWFRALPGPPVRLAFGLAGCPTEQPLAAVLPEQLVPLLRAVLRLFLQHTLPARRRMRQLLQEVAPDAFLRQLQARLPFILYTGPELGLGQPKQPAGRMPLGSFPQLQPGMQMLLLRAPLGRIQAEQLQHLAELAEQEGKAPLRLTPWQGVLLSNISAHHSQPLLQQLKQQGWLTEAAEPLSQLIACTGSRACRKGLTDTKADALWLATQLPRHSPSIHLSACERSCAAAHQADYTLLAQADGRYALYCWAAESEDFGQLLWPSLSLEQAAQYLAALPPVGIPHA